ncbi:MAG: T9SS type A sorting domain-containing protein, partial [Paludibacter sp.]
TGVSTIYSENVIRVSGKTIISENAGNIHVYNLAGSKVLSAATEGRLETTLAKGLYLVKFVDNSGNSTSTKININ